MRRYLPALGTAFVLLAASSAITRFGAIELTGAKTASAAEANQQLPVKLSAGVALPQTGPEGELMTFSVDYQFVDGGPRSGSNYLWVITQTMGDPFEQPVKLEERGTLQAIVSTWRGRNGPFESHLEEVASNKTRTKISRPIEMR